MKSELVNKHGLKRYIPEHVKRTVRQRDGFGCVLCGIPIIEYEHVDPEFSDAKEHNADCITILCPTCHARVTRNQISKALVKKAMTSPAVKKKGNVGDTIFFSNNHPTIILGGASFTNCDIPLMYHDEEIISIKNVDGIYLLNLKLWNNTGQQTLTIIDNEWSVSDGALWDLKVESNRIVIQEHEKSPSIIIQVIDNRILQIEKIDMLIYGVRFQGDPTKIKVGLCEGGCISVSNCHYGMRIS